jgi:hypothetical protein
MNTYINASSRGEQHACGIHNFTLLLLGVYTPENCKAESSKLVMQQKNCVAQVLGFIKISTVTNIQFYLSFTKVRMVTDHVGSYKKKLALYLI